MQEIKPRSVLVPLGILAATILLSVLTFFIPIAESTDNATAAHWRTAVSTAITVSFIGSGFAFISGLRLFRRELRVAYRLIATGIIAFSVALIQLVIWGVFDLWDTAWAASGTGLLPYVATAALIYAGMRRFAKLIGVRSWINSFWLVFGVTLGAAVVMGLLATQYVQYDIEGADLYIAVSALATAYIGCAATLAVKITRIIGSYYKSAMWWLSAALVGLLVAAAHETIGTFFFNNGDTYTDYGYYLILFVVAGLLFIRASYAFRSLSDTTAIVPDEVPVESQATIRQERVPARDYSESIGAVAALVSRPEDIQYLLDDLRFAAIGIQGAELSEQDQARLLRTYRELEKYLTQKDALRTFTAEEVRAQTTPAFRTLITG